MMVMIPIKEGDAWRAKLKPDGVRCPHLTFDGTQSSCAAHDDPIYKWSPCWIYGNPDVDPDFAVKRNRPCAVGAQYQANGGLFKIRPNLEHAKIDIESMEDMGPWPEYLDNE